MPAELLYHPMGHSWQLAPVVLHQPGVHVLQADALVAPVTGDASVPVVTPLLHGVQSPVPDDDLYVPRTQAEQDVRLPASRVPSYPALHELQSVNAVLPVRPPVVRSFVQSVHEKSEPAEGLYVLAGQALQTSTPLLPVPRTPSRT